MFNFSDFFIVELTYDCNLKCSYCYLQYDKYKHSKKKMTLETFKSFIDEVIHQKKLNGSSAEVQIVLHGGEPTLVGSEVLEQMIDYANEQFDMNGINRFITIQTNALGITEDFVPAFKKLNNVGISFDGLEDAFNMRSSNEKVKEKVLSSLKLLKENEVKYGFLSVISNKNIDDLNMYNSEYYNNAKLIRIYDTRDGSMNLKPGEFFEKVMKKDLDNLSYIYGSMSSSTLDRLFKRVFVDLLFDHTDTCSSTCNFRFCGAGMRIVAVQPDGTVHRCDRWTLNDETKKQMRLGHHKDYDFLGIKQLSNAVDWNQMLSRINKEGGCDTCYAKYACESDCQAMHFSRYGSYGIDKRLCKHIKMLYDYVEKNLLKIINELIDNNKVFVYREDYVDKNVKLRKASLLSENNIGCTVTNEGFDTYIEFRRKK